MGHYGHEMRSKCIDRGTRIRILSTGQRSWSELSPPVAEDLGHTKPSSATLLVSKSNTNGLIRVAAELNGRNSCQHESDGASGGFSRTAPNACDRIATSRTRKKRENAVVELTLKEQRFYRSEPVVLYADE